jgi:hypothetical protein
MNEHLIEQMAEAFRKVLGEGTEGDRAILIKRIPIICNDILEIKADMRWVKWISMGLAAMLVSFTLASIVTKII